MKTSVLEQQHLKVSWLPHGPPLSYGLFCERNVFAVVVSHQVGRWEDAAGEKGYLCHMVHFLGMMPRY